jgi:hypothetical protein
LSQKVRLNQLKRCKSCKKLRSSVNSREWTESQAKPIKAK